MKKMIWTISCFLGLFNTATQAAQLVLPNMPEGLSKGTFSISCTYNQGHYSSEGPVINWGNYGLIGSLNDLNNLVKDKDTDNFNVGIRLSCQNKASAAYQFNTAQLKAAGQIVLELPKNCA